MKAKVNFYEICFSQYRNYLSFKISQIRPTNIVLSGALRAREGQVYFVLDKHESNEELFIDSKS